MMNFYYDPIKGLQYEYLGEIIILDVAQIPKGFDIVEFLEQWHRYRTLGIDFFPSVEVEMAGRITDYIKI